MVSARPLSRSRRAQVDGAVVVAMGVVKIEVRRQGRVCVLRISGEISLGASTALLRRKCREVLDAGERSVVLDMLAVSWLDSSGIGEVMA